MALAKQYDVLDEDILAERHGCTEDEYFALEDSSPRRWEFVPEGATSLGTIRAMSGGLPDHSAIAMNLGTALTVALRGSGNRMCRVFGSDLKVHTADGRNTFPDVSVVCGALSFHRGRRDTVTNPILIAEVLSPSTAGDDRGAKRRSYQTIPSLQHYLILSAGKPHVELLTRQKDGWDWQIIRLESDAPSIPLSGLGISLMLSDLYDLIDFEGQE